MRGRENAKKREATQHREAVNGTKKEAGDALQRLSRESWLQVGWKWGRVAVCAPFRLVLAVHPVWLSSRDTPLGAGPGGKSIRAPGGRDVKHSHFTIW